MDCGDLMTYVDVFVIFFFGKCFKCFCNFFMNIRMFLEFLKKYVNVFGIFEEY